MKVNSFIKYQLKKLAPLFIVLGVICFAFGILANTSLFKYTSNYISTSLLFPTLLIPTYILPFFVFKDYFNKNMADTVNSFPANNNQINRVKILIGLIFLVSLSTFLHLCSILLNPSSYKVSYFVAFLFSLLSLSILYLMNCTLVSLGNTVVSSILYVIAGGMILGGFIPTLFVIFGWETDLLSIISAFGGAVGSEYVILQIELGKNLMSNALYIVLFVLIYLVQVGVGVLSFFTKEPSGEYYGAPGARNKYYKFIIYGAIGLSHVFINAAVARIVGNSVPTDLNLTLYLVMFIYSYIAIVLFDKKFKISKYDWIILGSVTLGGAIIRIIISLVI